MIVNTQIAYFLNSYWSGKLIDYPMKEQVIDILPSFILAIAMAGLVWIVGWLLPFEYFFRLAIQVAIGAVIVFWRFRSIQDRCVSVHERDFTV